MKNVPKLRFKDDNGRDFPDWEKKKLGDICNRIMDGTHFSPKTKEGKNKYLTSKNIRNEGLDLSNVEYIGDAEHQEIYKKCPVKFGDILLTKDGANTGNCCLNTLHEEFSLLSSVAVISSHPDFLSTIFLLQVLKSRKGVSSIVGAMAGQAITRITLEKIKNFIFYFPVFSEQTKIADFLTAIDDRISQLSQKCDGLAQYKKGVMQKIFSQELRFKDELGRAFPAWEEKRLGDVGVFQGGGTPTTADDRYWNGVVPWISSSDLNENSIHEISITRFISDLAIKESATKLIQKNSLLIVSRVGVGKLAVTLDKVCTSQDFTNFTPQSDNVFYLAYYLFFHKGKLLSFSQGTSIKGFTKDDISSLKVKLPCLKEQEKIAGFLSAVDEKISQAQSQLAALKQYKQGLLQQMFV